jgi:hypothetical protein
MVYTPFAVLVEPTAPTAPMSCDVVGVAANAKQEKEVP